MDMTNYFAFLSKEVSPGCSLQTHFSKPTVLPSHQLLVQKSGALSLVPGFSWFGLSEALTVHPTSQHGVVQMATRPQKPTRRASRTRSPTPALSSRNQQLCLRKKLI